jgi:hypothetical protein
MCGGMTVVCAYETAGVDVKRSLQIAAGGVPANWRKRQVFVASYLRLDEWRDPVSRG